MRVERDLATAVRDPTSEWVWLLAPGVVPRPGALDSLCAAVSRAGGGAGGAVVLAAGCVLTPNGALDPDSVPVPEIRRARAVLEAIGAGCVALRAARAGSLLVRTDVLRAAGVRSEHDAYVRDLEWSARALAAGFGLLDPASIAVRTAPARLSLHTRGQRASSRLRLLAAVEPRERLWLASHLLERPRRAERVA